VANVGFYTLMFSCQRCLGMARVLKGSHNFTVIFFYCLQMCCCTVLFCFVI